MHVGVITNPNSRKNRGRRDRAASLQALLGETGRVTETRSPEAIKPALRDFLRRGAGVWVSDGGDGALHWMLRAGLEVLQEPEFASTGATLPITLPTNGGTIDFVAKTAGIRGNAEQLLPVLRDRLLRAGPLETVALDTMRVRGVRRVEGEDVPFESVGFAAAVGGVGQRFFAKYYESDDPRPSEIVKVVALATASIPVALTPLRHLPGMSHTLRTYAREVFRPTAARVTVDGAVFESTELTGIHVAAIPINLGNVMRLFTGAREPGKLHAIYGASSPVSIIRNLPRMYLGRRIKDRRLVDAPCDEMTVEAIGDELLAPVIDGEYYHDVVKVTFSLGPRVELAKITAH